MLRNIGADEACGMLYGLPVTHGTEMVALGEALMRVSAAAVCAEMPVPPFDRSPYDGYAIYSGDTAGASRDNPAVLRITEEIPAGTVPRFAVTTGTAAKILTGAPIPEGADATIKYESTEFTADEVRIFEPIPPNTDIARAGSDVRLGDKLVGAGSLITAPVISSLANQGFVRVAVFRKPAITVISTGSELCEAGTPLRPASIYSSNVHTLSAYLSSVGAMPISGGAVPDEPDLIAKRLDAALENSDMVITTGGASVGDYDWAVTSAERIGAEVLFWKVSLRPGGAIVAATKGGKVILGLSGNPAAAVIGLLRVAMPFVKKLCGMSDCFYPAVNVALKSAFPKGSPKMRILRGRLEIDDSRAYFAESGTQDSGAVSSLAGCDLLGEIPMGSPPLSAGTLIKAYRI